MEPSNELIVRWMRLRARPKRIRIPQSFDTAANGGKGEAIECCNALVFFWVITMRQQNLTFNVSSIRGLTKEEEARAGGARRGAAVAAAKKVERKKTKCALITKCSGDQAGQADPVFASAHLSLSRCSTRSQPMSTTTTWQRGNPAALQLGNSATRQLGNLARDSITQKRCQHAATKCCARAGGVVGGVAGRAAAAWHWDCSRKWQHVLYTEQLMQSQRVRLSKKIDDV